MIFSASLPDFEIRQASIEDVPLILSFIKKLADYERLAHEVFATEESLRETLFNLRKTAEVAIGYFQNKPIGLVLFFHNYSTFLSGRDSTLRISSSMNHTVGEGSARRYCAT